MKIKELEAASGIPRASIRFYEKEGLLTPERTENGYRDYSDGDLETLKKILLLRALQVPLKDIRALQTGQETMDRALERALTELAGQREGLDKALRVCRELRADRVDYRDLPAQKYLDSFDRPPAEAVAKEDRVPRVQAPLRRFFARELDLLICSALWSVFLALVCNVGVRGHRSGLLPLLDIAVPLLLMLLLEPLLLHAWGATPGKWALGLRLTDMEGGRLPYLAGLDRTGRVLVRGLGLRIPVLSLVLLWKRYRACEAGKELSWEEDSLLALRDEKPWRIGAWAGLAAAVLALLCLAFSAAGMPRHRGDLTTAEFCDNFNRLAGYYGCSIVADGREAELDDTGAWTALPREENTRVLDLRGQMRAPSLAIREGPEGVEEVSFRYDCDNPIPSACQQEMTLTFLSFACAQRSFGLFSRARREVLDAIRSRPFESFEYTRGGVTVGCRVEFSGYRRVGGALFAAFDESTPRHYAMEFSVRRGE